MYGTELMLAPTIPEPGRAFSAESSAAAATTKLGIHFSLLVS